MASLGKEEIFPNSRLEGNIPEFLEPWILDTDSEQDELDIDEPWMEKCKMGQIT